MRLLQCAFAGFLLAASPFIFGADWPQWRGPNRDGICQEKGLLPSWENSPPELVFEAKGLGSGYSSVVVAGGRIYTMGGMRGRAHIVCLDEETGQKIWSTEIGGGGETNCTPTVDGDRIYGLGKNGDLACVDWHGKVLWKKNFSADFGGRMMSDWGYSESPLVDGERLICTPGGNEAALVALDKKTGDLIWKTNPREDVGGAGYASPVIAKAGNVKQYVQFMGRGLIGVAADDGRPLWGYKKIANGTANIPTPIVKDNFIFCSSGYGTGAALLKLTAKGKNVTAEEVYFLPSKTFQNHHGGMILIGNYVYSGHGHNQGFPICIEMATGKVQWSQGRGPGEGSAAIVAADGNLVFRYQNGVVALIQASPKGYVEKGTFQIPNDPGNSWPHPVIANGKLLLRVQDRLLCYNVKK